MNFPQAADRACVLTEYSPEQQALVQFVHQDVPFLIDPIEGKVMLPIATGENYSLATRENQGENIVEAAIAITVWNAALDAGIFDL